MNKPHVQVGLFAMIFTLFNLVLLKQLNELIVTFDWLSIAIVAIAIAPFSYYIGHQLSKKISDGIQSKCITKFSAFYYGILGAVKTAFCSLLLLDIAFAGYVVYLFATDHTSASSGSTIDVIGTFMSGMYVGVLYILISPIYWGLFIFSGLIAVLLLMKRQHKLRKLNQLS